MADAQPAEPTRISGRLKDAFFVWSAGVCDALALHQCSLFLIRSEVIRYRTLQCFMLNGVIFLGSLLLFNTAIEPCLGLLRQLVPDEEKWAAEFLASSFSVFYKALWIYPIYCISFVLNTVMYQEIADKALALRHRKTPQATPAFDRIINETFRVLLNLVYIIEMDLLYYVPFVGPFLYFVHTCWLASLYCFEYSWSHMRWSSNRRLYFFERHWLYFAGFGFPVTFTSFLCPRFIDSGVFALFFPICILTATVAEPRPLRSTPSAVRLPIFAAVQGVSCLVLRGFESFFSSSGKHAPAASGQPPASSPGAAGAAGDAR